jgi:hypothetical protein
MDPYENIQHPGDDELIDKSMLGRLVNANQGKQGYTYTHYPVVGPSAAAIWNRNAIRAAIKGGFVINLSADDLTEADQMADLKIAPVTTMLPSDAEGRPTTPAGRKIVICPVAADKLSSCAVCKLCAKKDRIAIIGFPAHGAKKNQLNRFLKIME